VPSRLRGLALQSSSAASVRELGQKPKGARFVVDVKSTGLFLTDPVLAQNGAKADYWKTGHSYIKQRVNEIGARAAR
jgi:phosphomannomutase/phosphoglucomutase